MAAEQIRAVALCNVHTNMAGRQETKLRDFGTGHVECINYDLLEKLLVLKTFKNIFSKHPNRSSEIIDIY